jgi:hypothetical protein
VTSPEEIIRERQRIAAEKDVADLQLQAAGTQREVEAIRRLVESVLSTLADRGYPGGELLQIDVGRTFFGRPRTIEIAAWAVCPYTYDVRQEPTRATAYLTSDGRFAATPLRFIDLEEVARQTKPGVFPSLDALRGGLEDLLRRYR